MAPDQQHYCTWEIVGNARCQAPPPARWIRNPWGGPDICGITNPQVLQMRAQVREPPSWSTVCTLQQARGVAPATQK